MEEVPEFSKEICLACLLETDMKLKPIYGDGCEEDLAAKIEECGGIKITPDDECPKQICHNCYAFLNIAHRFRTTCQRSQEELRRRYEERAGAEVKKEDVEGFENVLLAHVDCEYLEDQFVKAEEDVNMHPANGGDILELAIDLESLTAVENGQTKKRKKRTKDEMEKIAESAECEDIAKRIRKPTANENSLELSKNGKEKIQKEAMICHHCGNKYANKQLLHAHLKQHQSVMERENVCEICAKRFTTARHLQIHMNTHTGNRPFKCKYCPSAFGDPSSRIKHENAHANIRPYKCDVCEKAFTYSFALTNHRRIHTGEKPYSCSFCNRCFTQQHHKKTHELTHKKQANNK